VFFPMWQREALWLSFNCNSESYYALRIYVGQVNAVSGLKMSENSEHKDSINGAQDYVVVPKQRWLDGICVAPGIVRQFVAMPSKLDFDHPETLLIHMQWARVILLKAKRPEMRSLAAFRLR